MDKFSKLKELIKKYPKEQQAQILQSAARDPEMAKVLKQKALETENFDKRAGHATKTYQESLKNPNKGVTLTPTSQVTDMQKGLEGKLTAKQKILEAYKSDPFPAVVKPEPLKPTLTPEDAYIKSKLSIEDEANALKKAEAGKAFDIDNSNKATKLGIKNTPSSRFENLYSKKAIQEGIEAGAKAGAKSGAKAGMKTLPVLGAIGAGLWSGADAYADTGSMKEALKAGGAEAANITPIPTEIITGAIEDRDAIKKDLLLKKYEKEAEDKAKLDYINSPAKQAAISNYEDGGIEDEISNSKKNYFNAIKNKLNVFGNEKTAETTVDYDNSDAHIDKLNNIKNKELAEDISHEDKMNELNNAKSEEERWKIFKEMENKYENGGQVSHCGKFKNIKNRLK